MSEYRDIDGGIGDEKNSDGKLIAAVGKTLYTLDEGTGPEPVYEHDSVILSVTAHNGAIYVGTLHPSTVTNTDNDNYTTERSIGVRALQSYNKTLLDAGSYGIRKTEPDTELDLAIDKNGIASLETYENNIYAASSLIGVPDSIIDPLNGESLYEFPGWNSGLEDFTIHNSMFYSAVNNLSGLSTIFEEDEPVLDIADKTKALHSYNGQLLHGSEDTIRDLEHPDDSLWTFEGHQSWNMLHDIETIPKTLWEQIREESI